MTIFILFICNSLLLGYQETYQVNMKGGFIFFRYDIMTSCWESLPENRPTFTDIITEINKMLNFHNSKEGEYLYPENKFAK